MSVLRNRSLFIAVLSTVSVAFAQTQPSTRPSPTSPAEFAKALAAAKPGEPLITSINKLDASVPMLPLTITPSKDAATLVFSDRPEYFRMGDGIGSQNDVKPGRIRVYTYHVPVLTDQKTKRLITMVENLGDAEATLTFAAHSEPTPSGDYNAMAKEAMAALFNGNGNGDVLRIPPHGNEIADRSEPIEQSDLLVHGLFEFTTDQPLRITVAQVTATSDLDADVASIKKLSTIPMLPYATAKDNAGRGVFPDADRDVALASTYDTKDGQKQVVVADGKTDGWAKGVDGISGKETLDKGNYGIVYHLHLKWKSTDGRGVALLMTTARFEKELCGALVGVVRVNDGKNPGGVIPLPRDQIRFQGIPEACVIQTWDAPKDGAEQTIDLDYTPPGSCCLPTPLLLMPIDK